tara:strand:+ start:1239 stop:2456 length:1218 start_codon:yes stop_codon:yes gene_type:complete
MKVVIIFLTFILGNLLLSESLLFKNASVYTGNTTDILKNHDIYIVDGKISAIDKGIDLSADKIIDADGKIITAGFISPFSHLGLVEINMLSETRDDSTSIYSAGFSISQAFNPSSTLIPYNLNGGLTSAISAPSGYGLFSGLGSVFSLSGENNSLLLKDIALYGSIEADGESKAANLLLMEDVFEVAREFDTDLKDIQDYSLPDSFEYSKRDLIAIKRLLNREIPLVIPVNRASDILVMIEFAKNQNIDLVLMGVSEGWMVAKQLSESKIPVILEPINNLPTSFDKLGSRLENASLLHKEGVKILISSDRWETHNAYLSRQGAGIAVAYGLPWYEAVNALSKNIADTFNIRNRGTLTIGHEADLIIWDKDPLEVTAFAEQIYISGKLMSPNTRSLMLRDRYLNVN